MEQRSRKKVNRFRERVIKIAVTDYEYEQIRQKLKESGKNSMREYMTDMAINGYIINVNYSDLQELTREINKIGVNINQIAHKVNSENIVHKAAIDEAADDVALIWKMIRSKFYDIPL